MLEIILSLGSNLGNRKKNLSKALSFLSKEISLSNLKQAKIYETVPVDCLTTNTNFLNSAVSFFADISLKNLWLTCQVIEKKMGRVRTVKNAPRIIDLDIIFYGHKCINDELIIPHPLMHKRFFVLKPLNDICPNFIHPILKKTVRELLATLD